MPNLNDFKPEKRYKLLFGGDSGSGKSLAAASFPQPYHELDFDDRFGGIWQGVQQGILKQTKISYQGFDVTAGWEPVGRELDRLNIQKIAYRTNPGMMAFPYGTIGLGSLSSLRRLIIQLALAKMPGHQRLGEANDKFPLLLGSPGDTKAELNAINQVLDYLFSMPCNIIATAHICERWGKPKDWFQADGKPKDEFKYQPSEVIGERLTLSPNVAAEMLTRFDNVFKFQKQLKGGKIVYEVIFADGDIAKNGFGIPPGTFDFTGKEFYSFFLEQVEKHRPKIKEEVKA
jgi:hypothetical protein